MKITKIITSFLIAAFLSAGTVMTTYAEENTETETDTVTTTEEEPPATEEEPLLPNIHDVLRVPFTAYTLPSYSVDTFKVNGSPNGKILSQRVIVLEITNSGLAKIRYIRSGGGTGDTKDTYIKLSDIFANPDFVPGKVNAKEKEFELFPRNDMKKLNSSYGRVTGAADSIGIYRVGTVGSKQQLLVPVTNSGGGIVYRLGWIDTAPPESKVAARINELSKKYPQGSKYTKDMKYGNELCHGFAKLLQEELFRTQLPSPASVKGGKDYEILPTDDYVLLGQLVAPKVTQANVATLLKRYEPGAVLRVWEGEGGHSHTYTVMGVTDNGILTWDANWDMRNTVRYDFLVKYQTIAYWSRKGGVSLYLVKNYE